MLKAYKYRLNPSTTTKTLLKKNLLLFIWIKTIFISLEHLSYTFTLNLTKLSKIFKFVKKDCSYPAKIHPNPKGLGFLFVIL
jgi:hypothetical protein